MAVVVVCLCMQDCIISPYLDDWLIVAQGCDLPSDLIDLMVKWEKSRLESLSKCNSFLFPLILLWVMHFLPVIRAWSIQTLDSAYIKNCWQPVRLLRLMASIPTVISLARIHMQILQVWSVKRLDLNNHPLGYCFSILRSVIRSLFWWLEDINLFSECQFGFWAS